MPITLINRGSQPNDRTGTVLRTMALYINDNFTNHENAIIAAQTTANAASNAATAANTNANSRILSSARGVAGGVANLNNALRLNYALEIFMQAQAGNNGRVFVAPAGLHGNNSGIITGCYVIKLSNVTAMHTVHARTFNYGPPSTPGRGVSEFTAGLYNTTGTAAGAWPSSSLSQYGSVSMPISFAVEISTGRRCVIVGVPATQWVFGALQILDTTSHRSTIAGVTGTESVDVEFVTTLDAYAGITEIPDSGPYATANAALALANSLSASSFPVRPVPANGTDFNNVRDPGIYPVPTQAIGGTLLNMPPGMSTGVILVYPVSGSTSVIQVGIRSDARLSGKRRFASAAWNDWDLDLSKSNGVSLEGYLANNVDLNTLTTGGTIFGISSNATGATLVNWPEGVAGAVEVIPWATQGYVIQRGYLYNAGRQITRFQTGPTAWQPWREYAMLSSLGGTLPVANIPTGIPVANITGAAALTGSAFTGPVSVTTTAANPIAAIEVVSAGTRGATVKLTGDGATTPSKTIRARAGLLEVVNNGFTTNILTLTDAGALTVTGAVTAPSAQINGNLAITGTASGFTKAMVGLPNVDNTADSAKPVSAAQQTALNAKANLAGGTFTGPVAFSGTFQKTEGELTLMGAGDSSAIITMAAGSGSFKQLLRANRVTAATEIVNNANNNISHRFYDNGYYEPFSAISINNAQNINRCSLRGFGANQGQGLVLIAGVAGGAAAISMYNAGIVPVGSITTNDTSTAYNTTSDYRLKDEVGPVVGARTRIKNMRTFVGQFKAAPGALRTMMFAHEIADLMPYVVTGEKDAIDADGNIVPQQVDYAGMVPDLVAALGEEMALTDSLRDTITELQDAQYQSNLKYAMLEQKFAELVNRITALEQ